MKIIIKTTQIELTPALKEYTEKKIGSLGKFIKKIDTKEGVEIFVEIGKTTKHHKSGEIFYAEATMELPKKVLRVENSSVDLRAAIDTIKDVLKQSIQKYKETFIEKARMVK
ncbi:MAG: ribosome-associated translation inhibitor RaiA [Patescibacteria group bacterium]